MMDGPKPKASWEGVAPFPCAAKLHDWDLAFAIAAQQKTLKEAALYLAARGYPVIPCDPDPTHGPQFKGVLGYLASNGVYDATTNLETVERWWTEKPDALIGFPTGAITGCLVLDVDASPPHAHDGIRAWGELEVQHGSVTTRRHRTGNGGTHIFFAYNYVRPLGNSLGNLPKGIEVSSDGRLIIIPPSRIVDGRAWTIEGTTRLAAIPDWLTDILDPTRRKGRGGARTGAGRKRGWSRAARAWAATRLEETCEGLRNAPPKTRDETINKTVVPIGSIAAGGGLNPDKALAALLDAGSELGDDNLKKIQRHFEAGQGPRQSRRRSSAASA